MDVQKTSSTTRREHDKKNIRRRNQRRFRILAYITYSIIIIGACTAITYVIRSGLPGNSLSKEQQMILEQELANAKDYAKELQTALEKTTNVISDLNITIEDLKRQNTALEERLDSIESHIENTSTSPTASITRDTDLSTRVIMTTDRMNNIIDQWNVREGGSVRFVGHGQAFIDASKVTGLDPVYLLALSANESGFGTSRIAIDKNNFMGIGAYDASPYSSSFAMGDSIDQGIINGAIWVAENYYNQGQTTLDEMIYGNKQYCTSKDKWINDILWIWNTSYRL